MRKQIVILTFVLLIFCSASAMAGAIAIDLTESISATEMTFNITNTGTGFGTFDNQNYANASGWSFTYLGPQSIDATGTEAPGEFNLYFDSPESGLDIAFTVFNGAGNKVDYGTIDFNGSTWIVSDNNGPDDVTITPVPEPSLSLLLGLGLGAVTLTLGWKKQ
jgi:hypothetical protein